MPGLSLASWGFLPAFAYPRFHKALTLGLLSDSCHTSIK